MMPFVELWGLTAVSPSHRGLTRVVADNAPPCPRRCHAAYPKPEGHPKPVESVMGLTQQWDSECPWDHVHGIGLGPVHLLQHHPPAAAPLGPRLLTWHSGRARQLDRIGLQCGATPRMACRAAFIHTVWYRV